MRTKSSARMDRARFGWKLLTGLDSAIDDALPIGDGGSQRFNPFICPGQFFGQRCRCSPARDAPMLWSLSVGVPIADQCLGIRVFSGASGACEHGM